jgi:hypothetical protein
VGTEQPPHPVKPFDVSTEQLPERHDEEVPDGMLVEITVTSETVLKDLSPGASPLVISAQGSERLAKVPRR